MDTFLQCLFQVHKQMKDMKKFSMYNGTPPKKYGEYLSSKKKKGKM